MSPGARKEQEGLLVARQPADQMLCNTERVKTRGARVQKPLLDLALQHSQILVRELYCGSKTSF